jgi:hypothetical protein
LPNHVIEATTREHYASLLNSYILPELGPMPMVEILPGLVREWITTLQTVYGARPPTVRKCKVILDSILTTALNDQITFLHAGKGVKTHAGADQAAADYHGRGVRADLRRPRGRHHETPGGDRHRIRPALR